MSRLYKTVMGGCAFIAGAVTLAYIAVATISIGDGVGVGIEIPREINIMSCVLIVVAGTVAAEAWIANRAAREAIRPAVMEEFDRALLRFMPTLADEVASQVSVRTGAVIREVVAGEVADMIETGIRKAYRAGQISQGPAAKVVKMRLLDDEA